MIAGALVEGGEYVPLAGLAVLARLSCMVMLTGAEIRNEARKLVRLDTTQLRNSIRFDMFGNDRGEVSANTPYAAAQEWGRPDLPRYGFTPYMRPSAATVVNEKFPAIVDRADRTAQARAAI